MFGRVCANKIFCRTMHERINRKIGSRLFNQTKDGDCKTRKEGGWGCRERAMCIEIAKQLETKSKGCLSKNLENEHTTEISVVYVLCLHFSSLAFIWVVRSLVSCLSLSLYIYHTFTINTRRAHVTPS